ncbi:post-GPI attachment to proteins factor 3 [Neocloeon triangulifer]|uniref:post-GPI attachment to proteins factor 3 n=1 Tax=Neocloeon triangulifer TaxID=2078957 RepID=UPI00286EE4DF|nr:post-GPI attachment to proteins factor 3 [Neocloeon triangulifer]XP_059471647.1 post-GPI attachment to proteins factor 3 [Neocloeon triangulifer]
MGIIMQMMQHSGRFLAHAVPVIVLLASLCLTGTQASEGDRSYFFLSCMDKCLKVNCSNENSSNGEQPPVVEPSILQLLWSCQDECSYNCMWVTVSSFLEKGWGVPQFFGRWPFIRVLGLQEPASVVFSMMNLIANLVMLNEFQSKVPKSVPCYYLWTAHSWVCINAWFWSTVFHSRDISLTEKMDYFCAFSMVLFSFYSMVMRLLHCRIDCISTLFSILCGCLMVFHVTYLSLLPRFDYSYNMKANVTIGVLNGVGWLLFCYSKWHNHKYVWRCALSVVLAMAAMSLEILDFPPIFWTFDAHALWHLSTAMLPFLWYRFIIDDCNHLRALKDKEKLKIL